MIRPAEPSDDAACLAVYAPFVTGSAATFETTTPGVAEMRRRIGQAKLWLVAERDGRVAGYAYAGTHRARPAYRWTVETSVYIARAHARQGIGRELYAALLPALEQRGYRMALAGIALPNAASVALHEAVGFTPAGTFRRIGFKAGAWWDVGWWQRPLGDAETAPAEPL